MLKGKTVVVAGGTGNVGRHIVRALLASEADVVVPSRSAARIETLRREVEPETAARLITVLGELEAVGRAVAEAGPVAGAVASLGHFVPAREILRAERHALDGVWNDYVGAHWLAARALLPGLAARGGSYVMINGPLAFTSSVQGAGLVSVATAAQSMLARVLMHEYRDSSARINELVIYSAFGWGTDDANEVTGSDVGNYVAWLLSSESAPVKGRTIHLDSRDALTRRFGLRRLDGKRAEPADLPSEPGGYPARDRVPEQDAADDDSGGGRASAAVRQSAQAVEQQHATAGARASPQDLMSADAE
jgi:NAD(P)-dependent dehydrogenase (short-subunit alcohol dehydrogenase family)